MRFLSLLSLPLLTSALTLTLSLPHPNALPPTTLSTLSSHAHTLSTPISTTSTFTFHNVTAASYLFETISPTHTFAPLRIDVLADSGEGLGERVKAWGTFRGNEWRNLGEVFEVREERGVYRIELKQGREKVFWVERVGFSPLSILKNPLVLLALLGAGLMFGMPYLMENMDPEVKEAFEARQANGGGVSGQVNGLLSGNGGFDAAGWLAGTNKKEEGTEGVRR